MLKKLLGDSDAKSCTPNVQKALERKWCSRIIGEIERWRIQLLFHSPSTSCPKSLNAHFNRRAQSEDYYFSPRRFAFFSRYGRYVETNRVIIDPRRNFVRISWPNDTQCKTARPLWRSLMIQRTLMKLSRHVDYILHHTYKHTHTYISL